MTKFTHMVTLIFIQLFPVEPTVWSNFEFRIADCGLRICGIALLYRFLLNRQNTLNPKSKIPNPKSMRNKN